MKKNELITTINGIDFYFGGYNENGWNQIFTNDENFHVPKESDLAKECKRIYQNYYE